MNDKDLEMMFGITSEEIIKRGKAYENGDWPAGTTTRVGRPRLADEQAKAVTVRLPISMLNALDAKAARAGETRSAAVREAVDGWLLQA